MKQQTKQTSKIRVEIAVSPDGEIFAYPFDNFEVHSITGKTFVVKRLHNISKEMILLKTKEKSNVPAMLDLMREEASKKGELCGGLLWAFSEKELRNAGVIFEMQLKKDEEEL